MRSQVADAASASAAAAPRTNALVVCDPAPAVGAWANSVAGNRSLHRIQAQEKLPTWVTGCEGPLPDAHFLIPNAKLPSLLLLPLPSTRCVPIRHRHVHEDMVRTPIRLLCGSLCFHPEEGERDHIGRIVK